MERLQDAEVGWQWLRDCDGWLGELEDDRESVEDAEEVDLHDVASGLQFRDAREDEELRAIWMRILVTRSD